VLVILCSMCLSASLAVCQGYDRGLFNHWSKTSLDKVDLHSYSVHLARVAVRSVFNELLGRPGGCPGDVCT
jgi:hypothetical protein